MSKRVLGVAVFAAVLAMASVASAFSISSSQDLSAGGNIVGDGAGNTVVRDSATSTWEWGDRDGDDTGTPVATGGLTLGSNKVYTVNLSAVDIKLDLDGGAVTGQGAWNATTSRYDAITTEHRSFYGSGGGNSGDIVITNVGEVSCGTLSTHLYWTDVGSAYTAGSIQIGEPTGTGAGPAGNVRVDGLDTQGTAGSRAGSVAIYSTGSVRIEDSTGTTPGNITTNTSRYTGNVTVVNAGDFAAGLIRTYSNGSFGIGGDVSLNGGGAGGSCVVGTIDTRQTKAGMFGWDAGNVTITGYGSVLITNKLLASTVGTYNWDNPNPDGGDVKINNIAGDIHLKGGATCDGVATDITRDGYMSLATTGGGTIIIGDPDNPTATAFDLHDFEYSLFGSATGESWLWADLANVVEGTDRVRVANEGDVIYYSRDANADLLSGGPLGDGVYPLTGGGVNGTLEPEPLPIPEPAGLSLLGLALLGLRRRS